MYFERNEKHALVEKLLYQQLNNLFELQVMDLQLN